ncbi:MAG: hypothetical protein ABGX87_03325 [Alcanivorax sp.]|uniref:hypothetical protein n=1 Tax=Alloalcanivorax marinus TaxID=1177169 RepID=UPI0019570E4F|nr:hypothetical protein [Alloalcanivorax marinus]MBM7335116.1 hypothetical protein [Alloalcanivorax marinus]MCH2556356.1 hypothetical protein [Alcanivorax sp.]
MSAVFGNFLAVFPLIVPALIGIVLGCAFLSRYRKPAIMVIIASALMLLQGAFMMLANMFLVRLASDGVITWETYSLIASAVHFILGLSASALLLTAAFAGRAAPVVEVAPDARPHRGAPILVMGILSVAIFAPLGVIAMVLGIRDLAAMDAGAMDPRGRPQTTAGMVLGIIAIVLMVLALISAALLLYSLSATSWMP